MYHQQQLKDIAIRTATFKLPSNSAYPAPPSPIMPHITYSNEWSVIQTPVLNSRNSASFGSNCSTPIFTLEYIPPPPPPGPPVPPAPETVLEDVPKTKLNKQWSIQESVPTLSPKTSFENSKNNRFTPSKKFSIQTADTDYENKNNNNINYNNNNVYIYENIQTNSNNNNNNDMQHDIQYDNNMHDNNDTPICTPQPSTFNMGNPNDSPSPLVNNSFPAAFPSMTNNNNNNNKKRASDKSFKTISESSSNRSGTDNDDDDDDSTDSSSSSSTSATSDNDDATTEQQSYTDSEFNQVSDDLALTKYGYKILKKICTTIHGCVYEAKLIEEKEDHDEHQPIMSLADMSKPRNSLKLSSQTHSIKNCFNLIDVQHVAIKKVDKKMLEINKKVKHAANQMSDNDENIMKEAIILNYLSVLNKPPADNICLFIDFIETDTDFYLIQEYGGSQTLAHFVKVAHQYIQQKKLKLKHWRITVKFIFWQLSVMLYWMHNNMNVCHLDLNTDNILIKNGDFFLNQHNGFITVDSKNLSVKISDFGFAEIFPFDHNNEHVFQCGKRGFTKDHVYKSPQQYNGQIFDARQSDCYSLGVILYEMLTGSKPYRFPSDKDEGYLALQTKELSNYLVAHGLSKHVYRSTLSLVEGLINISEEERMNTKQILKHEWFKHYHDRYKLRIEQKTKSQYERHQRQAKKIKVLPYYVLKSSNTKHCVL